MTKIDMTASEGGTDIVTDLDEPSPFSTRPKEQQVLSTNVAEVQQEDTEHKKESSNLSPLRSAIRFLKSRFSQKQPATASTKENAANSLHFSDVEASGIEASVLRQEAASIDPYSYIKTRTEIQSSAIKVFKDRQSWAEEVGLDGTGRLPPVDETAGNILSSFNRSTSGPYNVSPMDMTGARSVATPFASKEASLFDRDECKMRVEMQRAALRFRSVHPQTLKDIAKDLDLRENLEHGICPMGLDCLLWTRFDKLVEDILIARHGEDQDRQEWWVSGNSTSRTFIEHLIPPAKRLQKHWQESLGTSYTEINERRRRNMMGNEGAMRGISFNPGSKKIDPLFIVKDSYRNHNKATEFGDQGFKPGQWWLNTWCASRDGILADPNKRATQVGGAVTALALLQGVEVDGPEVDTYQYTIEVKAGDMMSFLLGQRGRPIRLLRGYRLQSRYAPQVGLRYDGLYGVYSYSLKLNKRTTNTHELKIVLRQFPEQWTMEELSLIPTPEQMDDWKIFKHLLDAHIQDRNGGEWEESQWKDDETASLPNDTVRVQKRAKKILYKEDEKARPGRQTYPTQ